jgi:hypothetical protein
MSIQSELEAIRDADPNHILNVEIAHEWARTHLDSDLHRAIEWDKDKAAYQHQLWQIRQFIKIHVRDDRRAPTMISLTVDRVQGGGYRRVEDVMKVPDLRAIALRDALAELRRVQRKYQDLRELESVWTAVSGVEDALELEDAAE